MHLYHTVRHVFCPFVKPTLCVSHFQVPESQIMRVCAFSRPKDDLPIGLRRISNETDGDGPMVVVCVCGDLATM